jgi:hypothetical protein
MECDKDYKKLYEEKCVEIDILINKIKSLEISKKDEELNTIKIIKDKIIKLFNDNVKDKKIILEDYNTNHCGKEGHWLESQMNIRHNSQNLPDIDGFEMKKSSSKITIGDFSASEYAFSKRRSKINMLNKWSDNIILTKTEFIKYFG